MLRQEAMEKPPMLCGRVRNVEVTPALKRLARAHVAAWKQKEAIESMSSCAFKLPLVKTGEGSEIGDVLAGWRVNLRRSTQHGRCREQPREVDGWCSQIGKPAEK